MLAQNKNKTENDMFKIMGAGWILGIACMGKTLWPMLDFPLWLSGLLLIILLLQQIAALHWSHLGIQLINTCMAFVITFLLGLNFAQSQLEERLAFRELTRQPAEVVIYVQQINQLGSSQIRQPVQVLNRHNQPVQWLALLPAEQELQLGRYYRLQGQTLPTHSFAVPGAFDVEQWYLQQNIMSGFQVHSMTELTESELYRLGFGAHLRQHQQLWPQFKLWIETQRLQIRDFIQQQALQHPGLILALLTGDKSLLDEATEQQFQRFGMSHLLAISGPHVLIFAAMLCFVLQRLVTRYWPELYARLPRSYLLLLPFMGCVFVYCAYVGFEIPALRTLLICLVAGACLLLKQPIQPLSLLIGSASLLLLLDPLSVLSAAFWLSYGACFVLLRIYQTLRQQPVHPQQTLMQKLWQGFRLLFESQWKIFIALFPLMIIFFKQIAWIAPLSNLLAIPWIGLVTVPLDILAGLSFYLAEPLSQLLFQLNDLALSLLLGCLQLLDLLFVPQLIPVALSPPMLLSLVLGLMILFLPAGLVPKAWSALCLLPLLFQDQFSRQVELTVLDVGQGQAIFLRYHEHSMMIDMGGHYDEQKWSIGRQIIQPFLSVKGVQQLDYLWLTHLDQDHSGAYQTLKPQLQVQQVYANAQLEVHPDSRFDYCRQGQQWQWQPGIQIQVLSPKQEQLNPVEQQKNESSCVLLVEFAQAQPYSRFLLMGDAGWPTEYQLLQDYPDLKVDVLVLGHHGSRHSSSYQFLKQLEPKLAIASAGLNNRYGHPSAQVQARLNVLKIPLWQTAQQGSIQFYPTENEVLPYRHTRVWLRRD
nr:DNA internalization-related competence protein ComEC/Rec2 [Acinetobacter indicus]